MIEVIKISIPKDARPCMLWNDKVNLAQFGPVEVKRASRIEFNNATGYWFVESAKTGKVLKADFLLREEALAWEKVYYSPGGKGWPELVEDGMWDSFVNFLRGLGSILRRE